MEITRLEIADVVLLTPRVFSDDRGFFFESFNQKVFEESIGRKCRFVQDNHSRSKRGVLRGLHFQLPPKAQGKLVRVVQGAIFDVAVDIRRDSPTFARWVSRLLSAENKRQLWIPEGFAHGFLTLSETAEVVYKTTEYYAPDLEVCIAWNDETIGIHWPLEGPPKLSEKDRLGRAIDLGVLELQGRSDTR